MGRKAKPYSSFVEEVKKIHGDKYSYDESSYKGTNSLVAVLCPIHGNFQQWGHHLLKGRGCRDCAVEEGQASRRPYSEQEFLQKLEEVHRGKIALIGPYGVGDLLLFCKEHGSEFQKSSSFLIDRKQGCRGCYLDKVRLSFEEFEERALTLHYS